MDIDDQIEETKKKILELGLSDAPPSFIEDEEKHLYNLMELKQQE